MATASVDDLARTILSWLDENTPRFDGAVRRPWRTQRLEAAFRQDLQFLLLASIDVSARERLIRRLIESLQAPATAKEVMNVDWGSVIRSEDAASPIFRQIRQKLSAALPDTALPGEAAGLSSQEVAEKIIEALLGALSRESPETGESLIDILRQQERARNRVRGRMKRRRSRVRLFIRLLGTVIFAMSLYSIFDQNSWLTPSAILFSWFGFWILVATFIAQERTSKGKL